MTAPSDVYTADTVTTEPLAGGGLRLPGGAEVRGTARKGHPGHFACSRCGAHTRTGLRHDNPDDVREFRTFLAAHAGPSCPTTPAPTRKPRSTR